MHYKVCIKVAGRGTRTSSASGTNKALLPVGHRAVLSHIVHKFPDEIEIVLALGHNGQHIRDFLSLAFPRRSFTFVEVDNYFGPGSGPGYSILCCKPHLNCPFIFVACDTLVLEPIPAPTSDWIGVAEVGAPDRFLVADVREGLVNRFFDKQTVEQISQIGVDPDHVRRTAFIGLAGVHNHEHFWQGLTESIPAETNELQVSFGLNRLVSGGLTAHPFTWYDTGTEESYRLAVNALAGEPFLEKPGEFLYFEQDRVIKFFSDPQRAVNRAKRAGLLEGNVPEVIGAHGNFFAYHFSPGRRLADVRDCAIFRRFLCFMNDKLWRSRILDPKQQVAFVDACDRFYRVKTAERVAMFFRSTGFADVAHVINGIRTPSVAELLAMVDWKSLSQGIPVLFHGDPQPENVIVSEGGGITLLDWREDFAGLLDIGDLYYDLGKIYHALLISGEVIRGNQFEIHIAGDVVDLEFRIRSNLYEFMNVFESIARQSGWDMARVKLMTGLIYLNIAPLHHTPYNNLLFFLGKQWVFHSLETK